VTEAARSEELVRLIPVDQVDESPTNPRKTFEDLEDLARDIAERGLLQPVLVRPKGVRFELIVGARRFRASKLAEAPTIAALVREMDDQEVLETQIVENAKRSDLHPLEEAEAFETLMKVHGLSAEEIAHRVKKSRSWIYQRVKYCSLCEEAREAFREGKLTASTAFLVARIPSEKLQRQATKEITRARWNAEPMSYREALDFIERRFMLRLEEAPWKLDDAELLPAAGPCTTCPKRTGNQAELFEDVKSPDVCTEPSCFAKKKAAWSRLRLAEAKKAGSKILSEAESKKIFPKWGGLAHGSSYVELDQKCPEDPKHRSYRSLLQPEASEVAIGKDPKGQVHELLPSKGLAAALRKAGHGFRDLGGPARHSPVDKAASIREQTERKKQALQDEVRRRTIEAICEKAKTASLAQPGLLQLLARGYAQEIWEEKRREIANRLGLTEKKRGHSSGKDRLRSYIDQASDADLLSLLVELAVLREEYPETHAGLLEACEIFEVDRDAIARATRADVAKLAKTKPAKSKNSSRKKTASRKKTSRGKRPSRAED